MGHFFAFIARGLSVLFKGIRDLFHTILSWLFRALLFVRSNLRKLVWTALAAGILGAVYQYGFKENVYQSSMTLQPNFGSAVQLYKNIDYYYSLIEQEDYQRLASSLQIREEEAEGITFIEVEPYSNKNQVLLAYRDFLKNLDSSTMSIMDFKTYSKAQPVESFKYHVVTVTSKDKYIFTKLEEPIISSIIRNTYYDKVKTTSHANLISKKLALQSSMAELDSLRLLYKRVLLAESSRESSGTNIFLSEVGGSNKEVETFDLYMAMNQELTEVNRKLTEEDEVINVVSSFNAVGMKLGGWYRNFALLGLIGGFLAALLLITLGRINSLLKRHERLHQSQEKV